jgi:hypothetical protein
MGRPLVNIPIRYSAAHASCTLRTSALFVGTLASVTVVKYAEEALAFATL